MPLVRLGESGLRERREQSSQLIVDLVLAGDGAGHVMIQRRSKSFSGVSTTLHCVVAKCRRSGDGVDDMADDGEVYVLRLAGKPRIMAFACRRR